MSKEAMKLALEALEWNMGYLPSYGDGTRMAINAITALREALAEQEPVAMKFKIYKPTVPDPTRQDINNALLPWVHDQDRSSGFDASMWVTPVATLPPQRKPLTEEEIDALVIDKDGLPNSHLEFARAIEAAHGIKENT